MVTQKNLSTDFHMKFGEIDVDRQAIATVAGEIEKLIKF